MKKSLLVEADGGPLAIEIAGANVPDAQLLAASIEAVVLERPEPEPDFQQHLALDKAYDNDVGYLACIDHGYTPHIAAVRATPPPAPGRHPARRWVVERTLAWLGRSRRLSKEYEHWPEYSETVIYLASLHFLLKRLAPPRHHEQSSTRQAA